MQSALGCCFALVVARIYALRTKSARVLKPMQPLSLSTPSAVHLKYGFHSGGSKKSPTGLENYTLLTPGVEVKEANLYGASAGAVLLKFSNAGVVT
jgi:hypothetical protein